MSLKRPIGFTLLALLAAPLALAAQHAPEPPQVAGQLGAPAFDLLERPARLTVTDVSLYTALTDLESRSGVSLVYSPSRLPLKARVSCACYTLNVGEALDRMLEGTRLRHSLLNDHILIEIDDTPVPRTTSDGSANVHFASTTTLLPTLSYLRPVRRVGTITGRVTDAGTGAPIAGASVAVEGTQLGSLTNPDGRYVITNVPEGAQRVRATRIGYVPISEAVTLATGQTATVDFVLEAEAIELEGIVAVGYGSQRKETLTGAVSAVSGEVIEKVPVVNTSNAIAGAVPGVVVTTSSGEPGYDGSTIRIRGNHTLNNNNPLIVVDGVPNRSGGLDRLSPHEIESISVLKDASAAIYGAQAANGVILVTTKRGRDGTPRIAIDLNQGFNQPTRIPEMADAATYLTMLNEIELYRGRQPAYTQQEIENFRLGADPWLYPDTDWYDEALKPVSYQTTGNARLSGGGERLRYFLSLGGLTEDGYYRNSATRYNQYNFRSNVDGDVTDYLSIRFDVSGRLEDRNFPTQGAGDTFRMLMRGKPNLPAFWPNGTPGPDIEYGQNPVVTGTDATGYNNDERYFLQGNLGLDLAVPGVEGLEIRGNAAYDKDFRSQKVWQTPWTLYTWDYQTYDENGEPVLIPGQRGYSEPRISRRHEDGSDILLNLVADYRTGFGNHSLGALVGVERQKFDNAYFSAFRRFFISDQVDELFAGGEGEMDNAGSSGTGARQNYFSRINYDYAGKYLLELVGRYDGSYIFPEEKRYGFFPAVSAGWRISQEPFFQNRFPLFDDLKFRASWGQTGNDRIDEWQYLATYGFGSGYVVGVDREVKSLYQTRTPNPEVTWEVANQFDVGLDAALFANRLSLTLDYFDYKRSDILHFRNASVPQSTGLSLPRENIGEVDSWGFDGTIAWDESLNEDFSYGLSLVGGYAKNRIAYWDEPPGAPEWQRSTGAPMNTGLYYVAKGVFNDSSELNAYPHWVGARPGDIIFEDVDGDGEITADDRIRVDRSQTPTWTGGLTLDSRFRQFDVSLTFQGAAGGAQYIRTESGDLGNFFADYARNRWTPENPDTEHPRTFNGNEEYWMSQANTYFLRSTDYVRLKTAQIGYTLPTRTSGLLGASNLRVYVSGFNLLTWDKLDLLDPEATTQSGAYYPQKRVLNVGLSAAF